MILQFFKCCETKPLNVWFLPPRKTELLLKNFVLPCIPITKSSHRRCLKNVIKNFGKFQTRTPVLESLFDKAQGFKPVTLFKKTPTQVLSCEIFENFKDPYCEEHLCTTAPECLRKFSPLVVLGKPKKYGKRQNWATNTSYSKYEPHKVSSCNIHILLNEFCDIFQEASEEGKSDIAKDFKFKISSILVNEF